MDLVERVMRFWFGAGSKPDYFENRSYWFETDAALDDQISRFFGHHHEKAAKGDLDHMANTPEGVLSLVILFDQFSRNLYRNKPEQFAFDDEALTLARAALDAGRDNALIGYQKAFLYMPFMHSEDLKDQERSVELYSNAGKETFLEFAKMHRDLIARFGRFPHRNKVLGRKSTKEEAAFLEEHGRGF